MASESFSRSLTASQRTGYLMMPIFFDGIGQVGNRRFDVSAVIDFGIDQVLGLRTGNGVEQFLRADVLAADEGHDNGAELFAQLLESIWMPCVRQCPSCSGR